jgi:hypothetical protein
MTSVDGAEYASVSDIVVVDDDWLGWLDTIRMLLVQLG